MRKPRDFDSELKALDSKARLLKQRKVQHLGELVIACRADALDPDLLAGALLAASTIDSVTKEGWRENGASFFRGRTRTAARGPCSRTRSAPPRDSGAQSAAGEASAE